MDRTNFIDFIKESESKEPEIHGWQLIPEEDLSSSMKAVAIEI
jgi:hypothetical protein